MNGKLLKISLICVTGIVILVTNNNNTAMAYEEHIAGIAFDKVSSISKKNADEITLSTMSTKELPIPGFTNLGIADVNTNLLIRKGPSEKDKILGKIPRHGGVEIIELNAGNGWSKVKSGKLTGYSKTQYLIIGTEAAKLALEVGNHIATANADGLRVRKNPSVSAPIIDKVAKGEELLVIDELVVTYGEENNKWVKISLDGDSKDGDVGYVAKQYVDLSYALKKAISMAELEFGTPGISQLRMDLVNYAKKYLGNRYVYGGNSLTKGIDCSGFTKKVYAKFGYSIARVSRTQAKGGTKISSSKLKPGDLVFYGNKSTGYINHVAIYMGNGRVIHASNPRDGIKTSKLNYRTPVKCVRYIKN